MNVAYEIIVRGRVQGVAFRYYAKLNADRIGVKGRVKNLNDGSVLIQCITTKLQFLDFIKWCHNGSPASKVEELHYYEIDYFQAEKFEIIR